jgi:hypothetical protein
MTSPRTLSDQVTYTVQVEHWADGEVRIAIANVGGSEHDRNAIASVLRMAADMVEQGNPDVRKMI